MASMEQDLTWKSLLFRDLIKPPRPFSMGDNLDEFLHSFERYCQMLHLQQVDEYMLLMNNLADEIRCELLMLPDYNAETVDISWVKEKLKSMFGGRKISSPTLELMTVHQQPNQTIREFITSLRLKAFKIHGRKPPKDLEQQLLVAFHEGLADRTHAAVVKVAQPGTLEEAYDVLRKEKIDRERTPITSFREEENVRLINNGCNEVKELKEEIAALKEKIDNLKTLVESMTAKSRNDVFQRTNSYKRNFSFENNKPTRHAREVQCYNCQKTGHISKNCRFPCSTCKSKTHTSGNCPERMLKIKNKFETFREIKDDFSDDAKDDVSHSPESVYVLQTNCNLNKKTNTFNQRSLHKGQQKKDSNNIEKWVQFINNQGDKPKFKKVRDFDNKTLITIGNKERARNKPIVMAKIEQTDVKILFDSGAECNVIDKNLLNKIKDNSNIKCEQFNGRIKCANGALQKVLANCWLTIDIGGHKSRHPFRVVDGMFPQLIAGIRLMKSIGISVCPQKDCIKFKNQIIPFISVVDKEEKEHVPENIQAPSLGVGARC